ncbi:TrbL protein of DNA transfer system [Methyloglobulus morosus KoM1]|uniref:TrbL protein of DNA transfer system n=1 Tax=Methyloglobulus morosus KoM1 TaxID=1116472 RepID=V5DWI1_9GAMM|nr:P-type conjugative transfer protein TrbL [Methyloglobulus morosus]ESS71696.1 TrbL protein of DNA transfer system [Methyloglobulus morosus KoM1]
MKTLRTGLVLILLLSAVLTSNDVLAATPDSGVFDTVMGKYQSSAAGWEKTIKTHAYQLFWGLTLISMVWTFGILALKKADISDFFVELIRFLGFTGFYLWLLDNGPQMAMAFINSLKGIAGEAANVKGLEPVGILNTGLDFFQKIVDVTDFSVGAISQAIISMIIGLVILFLFGLIAVNMMLLNIAGWILAYAGIFFLGFGGSRWTSDIAIAFYKNVLMVGAQLMTMMLVVGIGQSFIADLINLMSAEVVMKELGVILIATLVLYGLANKVPTMVSSIVTGHINTGHIGQAGTGALLAGATTAAAVANQAAQAAISTAQSMSGGVMALQAALKSSSGDNQTASNTSSMLGNSGSNTNNSGSNSLASAMGDAVGSIGGIGNTSPLTSSENQTEQQASNSRPSSSVSSQKSGGESFGKALARGIGELAKDKIAQTKQNIRENTFGGKLATAIANPGALAQQSAGFKTSKETPNFNAEIAAFRDKKTKMG